MPHPLFLWQRESWRAFWRQRTVVVPLMLAAVLLVAGWLVALTRPAPLTVSLAARYSIYVGTNWLTEPWVFWLVPGLATLFVVLDVALAYTIARRTLVLRYLWLWSAVVLALGFLWLAVLLSRFNS